MVRARVRVMVNIRVRDRIWMTTSIRVSVKSSIYMYARIAEMPRVGGINLIYRISNGYLFQPVPRDYFIKTQ